MERFKCRLCFKSFVNGRALGGHTRSHMLTPPSKRHLYDYIQDDDDNELPSPLSHEIDSGETFPSSSSSEEDDDDDEGNVVELYGLRDDDTKRISRVADQEFAFDVVGRGSVLLQDDESEPESTRINPTRKRSDRTRKLEMDNVKRVKTSQLGCKTDPEQLSSVSDTTTEEDLAFCLMMLSRDKWKQKKKMKQVQNVEEEKNTDDQSENYRSKKNRTKGKYKCETCGKVFKSYQALGGHRASHKKNKVCRTEDQRHGTEYEVENVKTHECPICFRVFSSGQALGGHKRSHGSISLTQNHLLPTKQRFIDLNLPAPTEDDESSTSRSLCYVR